MYNDNKQSMLWAIKRIPVFDIFLLGNLKNNMTENTPIVLEEWDSSTIG